MGLGSRHSLFLFQFHWSWFLSPYVGLETDHGLEESLSLLIVSEFMGLGLGLTHNEKKKGRCCRRTQ